MIARRHPLPESETPMKHRAIYLITALMAGCAPVDPIPAPAPPGMPIDSDLVPEFNDAAVTGVFSGGMFVS